MVNPKMKRALVNDLIKDYHFSQRRALKLVNLHRSVGRYVTKMPEDEEASKEIKPSRWNDPVSDIDEYMSCCEKIVSK
jgi:hypothetical protein